VGEAPSAGTQHDAGNGGGAISHLGQCSPRIKFIWQYETKEWAKGARIITSEAQKDSPRPADYNMSAYHGMLNGHVVVQAVITAVRSACSMCARVEGVRRHGRGIVERELFYSQLTGIDGAGAADERDPALGLKARQFVDAMIKKGSGGIGDVFPHVPQFVLDHSSKRCPVDAEGRRITRLSPVA